MRWLWCSGSREDAATIERLTKEVECLEEDNGLLCERAYIAERDHKELQDALAYESIDELCKETVAGISDAYVRNYPSVRDRDCEIYRIIYDAISRATIGERHWDSKDIARRAYND